MSAPQFITFHGRTGMKISCDGMEVLNFAGNGFTGFIINNLNVAEMALESSGVSAESASSGFSTNAIPKEGSNRFAFNSQFLYTTKALNSENHDDEMRSRGLTSVERVLAQRDGGFSFGGPLAQNKLWFLTSARKAYNQNTKAGLFFNKTVFTPVYTPDPDRPALRNETFWAASGRLTWQASPRNKVNGYYEGQHLCGCPREGFYSPEAAVGLYVTQEASTVTNANNPFTTSVTSVNRTWNDAFYAAGDPRRGNFAPDCDLRDPLINGECGAISNQNFGRLNPTATQYDPAVLRGFGVRPASWDVTTELQQQLGNGMSFNAGYYRS
jgi:hypothetical protein